MADHRPAILDALRTARSGLDLAALADRLELHPNTVRWHLGVLARDGLVASKPERRGRGRPAIVYRLTGDGIARDRDEYRLLATMLTSAVAGDPEGATRAYDTGHAWGAAVATQGDSVIELLDDQGFGATQEDETIEMRRCPFWALAAGSPEVICTLHRGLIDGMLEETGSDFAVADLQPFVEPTLCVARLRPARTRRDGARS